MMGALRGWAYDQRGLKLGVRRGGGRGCMKGAEDQLVVGKASLTAWQAQQEEGHLPCVGLAR